LNSEHKKTVLYISGRSWGTMIR